MRCVYITLQNTYSEVLRATVARRSAGDQLESEVTFKQILRSAIFELVLKHLDSFSRVFGSDSPQLVRTGKCIILALNLKEINLRPWGHISMWQPDTFDKWWYTHIPEIQRCWGPWKWSNWKAYRHGSTMVGASEFGQWQVVTWGHWQWPGIDQSC